MITYKDTNFVFSIFFLYLDKKISDKNKRFIAMEIQRKLERSLEALKSKEKTAIS